MCACACLSLNSKLTEDVAFYLQHRVLRAVLYIWLGFYSSCVPLKNIKLNWGNDDFALYVSTLCPTFLILAGVLYLVVGCCGGGDVHDHRKALAVARGKPGAGKAGSKGIALSKAPPSAQV